jgi:hypothetical protein
LSAILSGLGRSALRLVLGLVVIGVLAGGFFIYKIVTHNADLAKAGDCLTSGNGDANKMKTVGCDKADAKYKVLGRVSGSATSATVDGSCTQWDQTEAAMYTTGGGSKGYVLCLQEIKH